MFVDMVNTIESILTKVAQYLDFNDFVLTIDTKGKGIPTKKHKNNECIPMSV